MCRVRGGGEGGSGGGGVGGGNVSLFLLCKVEDEVKRENNKGRVKYVNFTCIH